MRRSIKMQKMPKKFSLKQRFRQKGVALILIAVILALAAAAYAIKVFNVSSIQATQDVNASIVLADAKATLLGYTLGRVGAGERPGNMPMPDYFASTEVPSNYDGLTDSGCMDSTTANGLPLTNTGANMRCLGRLPWQTIGLAITSPSQNDVLGNMPWYAVSANLVDTSCLPILNPRVVNMTFTGYVCSGTTLPHPWLTVRDSRGNVLSSRVAIVLILPGRPVNLQTRQNVPLGDVTNYLDSVVVPAGCSAPCVPGTYSNKDLDNDFIMASSLSSANVDQNNQNLVSSINDKILFITIDELMATIQTRVVGDVRKSLIAYNLSQSKYPNTASLGYQGRSAVKNQSSGFLPLPICTCIGGTSCDCAFPGIIKFTSDSNYQSSSATGCSFSGKVCTCTGEGSCFRASVSKRYFICSKTGTCNSNITGKLTYQPSAPIDTTSSLMTTTGACSTSGIITTCTNDGTLSIAASDTDPLLNSISVLPTWFDINGWKHYFYYTKGSLQVGSQPATVLVIGTGDALGAQIRPSSSLADYLDSTNLSNVYDATNTPRTSSYNDQMYIVAP